MGLIDEWDRLVKYVEGHSCARKWLLATAVINTSLSFCALAGRVCPSVHGETEIHPGCLMQLIKPLPRRTVRSH